MTNQKSEKNLIPEIKKVTVGIREPREVTIYPLSMYDQLQIMDRLTDLFEGLDDVRDLELSNVKNSLGYLKTVIFDNMELLLEYITDENERPTLSELTNNQFYAIAEIVFTVNFEGLIKNFTALAERASGLIKKKEQTEEIKKVQ